MAYEDVRTGGGSKQDSTGITPMIGDVVVFKDSKQNLRFGLILEILESNTVKLKTILRGKGNEDVCHTRLLKLIYRTSNQDCFTNLD